jgi:hypothetical protein
MNGVKRNETLAIVSLVLGILSVTCFGLLAGIPAIITGIIAYSRTRNLPEQYGGGGFAIAGLVMGCFSFFVTMMLAGMLLPALAKAKDKATSVQCVNNMRQIGVGARLYATDNHDKFPTSFLQMTNELATPRVLVCPADKARKQWSAGQPMEWDLKNISYEFLTPGLEETATNLQQVAFRCPIHGHEGLVDGSVRYGNVRTRQR